MKKKMNIFFASLTVLQYEMHVPRSCLQCILSYIHSDHLSKRYIYPELTPPQVDTSLTFPAAFLTETDQNKT